MTLGPVYVASSWKNDQWLNFVHRTLVDHGMTTLDFRVQGRWWTEGQGRHEVFGRARSPDGENAFDYDFGLMNSAKAAFVVLPAGESVALETGWFAGSGKPVVV